MAGYKEEWGASSILWSDGALHNFRKLEKLKDKAKKKDKKAVGKWSWLRLLWWK